MSQRPRDTGLPHPADGCPQCIAMFSVVPYRVEQSSPEGVRCWYRCPRCLHSWWTSWGTDGCWDNQHYYPDSHDRRVCPCGCGIEYLRPSQQAAEGDAA